MPPRRFILTQSWWLATRLVRRHPELTLIETHPGGGQYDCLTLIKQQGVRVDINREGSIHTFSGDEHEMAPMSAMFEPDSAAELIAKIERVMTLGSPHRTPPSTPAVLTFRVVAQLMAITLNAEQEWDVRSVFADTSGGMGSYLNDSYLEPFALARKRAKQTRRDDLHGNPYYRYWAVLDGGKPVAIVDTDGYVYPGDEALFLPDLYAANNRRLTPTVAAALDGILP